MWVSWNNKFFIIHTINFATFWKRNHRWIGLKIDKILQVSWFLFPPLFNYFLLKFHLIYQINFVELTSTIFLYFYHLWFFFTFFSFILTKRKGLKQQRSGPLNGSYINIQNRKLLYIIWVRIHLDSVLLLLVHCFLLTNGDNMRKCSLLSSERERERETKIN